MNIILCGYKACGKTTIGNAFAKQYDYHFIDTDDLILSKENFYNPPIDKMLQHL